MNGTVGTNEIDQLSRHLDGVPGWLSQEEATTLFDLAKRCTGRGVIVEIGSFKGRSTICLGRGSMAGNSVPIYAIDPWHDWTRFAEFKQNIERACVSDLVTPIGLRSADAFEQFEPESIELLFIDGSHQYEMVMLDFDLWTSKLVEGGMLVMHDTTAAFPGSKKVAEDRMYRSHQYRGVRFVYSSMTVGQKAGSTTPRERLANHWALGVKRGFELLVAVRHRIPAPLKKAGRRTLRVIQRAPGRY